MTSRNTGYRCSVCGAYATSAEAAVLCQKRTINPPKFQSGGRVRTSFFYQRFPDGYEGQNRFEVLGLSGLRPSDDIRMHEQVYQVRMLVSPFAVRDMREGELDSVL